jgi:hypothetical protein
MNFSEYTLVSFGDSFTFGEDTVPVPEWYTSLAQQKEQKKLEKKYKKDCNSNSYTKFLSESLGFKDSINFGLQGASNDRSMMNLESFLRSNKKKKVFILFNFTHPSRYIQFFKRDDKNEYDSVNMLPNYDGWKTEYGNVYTGINTKTISQNWTFFRNSIQDVYNHVKQRRAIYYILSSYNVPYATFDGINDMDACMIRDNPMQYINKRKVDGCFVEQLYNDESYIFKEMDFLNSYYEETVNNTPLLNHLLMDYSVKNLHNLNGKIEKVDMNNYIWKIGIDRYDDKNNYVTNNGHWTTEGHIEVAKVLEEFIRKSYN